MWRKWFMSSTFYSPNVYGVFTLLSNSKRTQIFHNSHNCLNYYYAIGHTVASWFICDMRFFGIFSLVSITMALKHTTQATTEPYFYFSCWGAFTGIKIHILCHSKYVKKFERGSKKNRLVWQTGNQSKHARITE